MFKILVVDDSQFMRKIVIDKLIKNDFNECLEASNGFDALEIYKSEKPDIVILDMIMPDKDGVSTLIDIIEYDKTANVIACSALANNILIEELMHIGISGFLVKPFNEEALLCSIKKILEK